MKKYLLYILRLLRIFTAIFRISLVADLEFRTHFFFKIIVDIIWYGSQLAIFEALFCYTSTLGSWTIDQTRVFLGVLFISDALYMIFFSLNVENFTDIIQKGDLDMILTKPVSSQLMISCRKMSIANVGSLLISIIWTIWAISNLPQSSINDHNIFLRTLWLIILIPSGLMIHYSIRFMLLSLNLIFIRADYLQFLWFQFYRFSFRSDSLFPPNIRIILLTILPLGFIASVPSRIVIDPPSFELYAMCIGGGIGLSVFFIFLSSLTWNWALKFYSSASS